MAAVDYGAVIRVDRKYRHVKDLFESMESYFGEEFIIRDPENILATRGIRKEENGGVSLSPYRWLGSKEFFLAINARTLYVVKKGRVVQVIDIYELLRENRKAVSYQVEGVDIFVRIGRYAPERYYVRFVFDSTAYEGIFGYGVDPNLTLWYDLYPNEKRVMKDFMGMGKQERKNKRRVYKNTWF